MYTNLDYSISHLPVTKNNWLLSHQMLRPQLKFVNKNGYKLGVNLNLNELSTVAKSMFKSCKTGPSDLKTSKKLFL